jgi:hypothetical protein
VKQLATSTALIFIFLVWFVPAQAQCMRCGAGAQCVSADSGGEWCMTECAGNECTCFTSGSCGLPWDPWPPHFPTSDFEFSQMTESAPASVPVPSAVVEQIRRQLPDLYEFVRLLTQHGRTGLRLGPFEGIRARLEHGASSDDPGDKPLFEFIGYVDLSNDQIELNIEFIGHQRIDSMRLEYSALFPTESLGSGKASVVQRNGDSNSLHW